MTSLPRRIVLCCATTLLTLGMWPGAASAAALVEDPPLTNGRTYAHWSHPELVETIRRFPNADAARVASTRLRTEGGAPEVYPLLRGVVDEHGQHWYQVGIPMRPNGRTGWVRDEALGPAYRVTKRLLVDRVRLRATLYDAGQPIWTSRIGIGAVGSPTPAGRFWIREKLLTRGSGMYGPRAFGTSNYSTLTDWPGGGVIGIHGTDEPGLIPGRPSHGCIRVRNAQITRLYRLMPVGTPLLIS